MLCDLCSRQVADEKTFRMPLRTMRQAVDAGFNPFRSADMHIWRAMPFNVGLSKEDLFREWRRRLVQDRHDWRICPMCAEAFQTATGRMVLPMGEEVTRRKRPRLTLGELGQRHRYTLYFVFAVVVVLALTVEVCRRFDWTVLHRAGWEKRLLAVESHVIKTTTLAEQRVSRLAAECGRFLRDRWMAGYLYDQTAGREYYIGRPLAEFRRAIEAQKALIAAGKPIETKKIPRFRFDLQFAQLKCRLVVAGVEPSASGREEP